MGHVSVCVLVPISNIQNFKAFIASVFPYEVFIIDIMNMADWNFGYSLGGSPPIATSHSVHFGKWGVEMDTVAKGAKFSTFCYCHLDHFWKSEVEMD